MNARRWHIFEDGRSLCNGGSWLYFGADDPVLEGDNYREGEDCKACCRKAGLLEEDDE